MGKRNLWATCLLATSACTSVYLTSGRTYMARGNLPVAVEVMDAGLTREPGNEELRDALVLAEQSYQYELRQDIDRLVETQRLLLALRRLISLEEVSRRAAEIPAPAEDPKEIERERQGLVKQAIAQLERSLDERAGRGLEVKADLATCRQLQALVEDNPEIAKTCERLRGQFQRIVILEPAPGSAAPTKELLVAISAEVQRRHPELLEVVSADAGRHNAVMRLYVGEPQTTQVPFVLTERQAFHRWVPMRDKKGKEIKESVVVPPSQKDIDEAKRKKKPAPQPKKVLKTVYFEVRGEYQQYKASNDVVVPFRVEIEDLRSFELPVVLAGVAEAHSEAAYHVYEGHPEADTTAPRTPRGRGNAPRLVDIASLVKQADAGIPARVVQATLERVE